MHPKPPKAVITPLLLAIIFLMLIEACEHKQAKHIDTIIKTAVAKPDTDKSFKIDDFWITPKPGLDYAFGNAPTTNADTVNLPICSDYAFSPFGNIKNRSELPKSLLKHFSIVNKIDTSNGNKTIVQSLKLDSNKLLLFFDHDPEASRESYVIKGEIYDKTVTFANNIRIDMSEMAFYQMFFTNYPESLQNKYQVITFETCIEGLRHIYTFQNHHLHSVKFECVNCTWKADY
jgi:hypothetical protein